jgi:hypothetical protein
LESTSSHQDRDNQEEWRYHQMMMAHFRFDVTTTREQHKHAHTHTHTHKVRTVCSLIFTACRRYPMALSLSARSDDCMPRNREATFRR